MTKVLFYAVGENIVVVDLLFTPKEMYLKWIKEMQVQRVNSFGPFK